MNKKRIIWLEDNGYEIYGEKRWCEQQGFEVKIVNHPARFLHFLEEDKDKICLLVIDIMIHGVNNLTSIGILDTDTLGGKEAGWEIVRCLLRAHGSSYADLPIMLVSAKFKTDRDEEDIVEYSHSRGMAPIYYIEKRSTKDYWSEIFKQRIMELVKK